MNDESPKDESLDPTAHAKRQARDPKQIEYWIPQTAKRCVACSVTHMKGTPKGGQCACGSYVFTPVLMAESAKPDGIAQTVFDLMADQERAKHMVDAFSVLENLKTTADRLIERQERWDLRGMSMARLVAEWSKDPSTKVGACLFNSDNTVAGVGYNGFPRGVEDTEERLQNRDLKYPIIVHAELNALFNSTLSDNNDMRLYVTHFPCADCAGAIIQSESVAEVIVGMDMPDRWGGSCKIAKMILKEAGIRIRTLNHRTGAV